MFVLNLCFDEFKKSIFRIIVGIFIVFVLALGRGLGSALGPEAVSGVLFEEALAKGLTVGIIIPHLLYTLCAKANHHHQLLNVTRKDNDTDVRMNLKQVIILFEGNNSMNSQQTDISVKICCLIFRICDA